MSLPTAKAFQITFLSLFLGLGVFVLDFQITPVQCGLCMGSALAFQFLCFVILKIQNRNYLSPIITALSLCLLLRSNTLWVHPTACVLGLGSKFLIRSQHNHFFNPANFGIIICAFFLPAWVSQGQWGHHILLLFFFTMLGWVVTQRARTGLVSLYFLMGFAALVFFRHAFLGFEQAMTLHALSNGALMVFAFFMISDPKTNPKSHLGKGLHILTVLLLYALFQFEFYFQNALFLALFVAAPFWPFWDRLTMTSMPSRPKSY